MSDPFEIPAPAFDPVAFANGLLAVADKQRESMAERHKSNVEMVWNRTDEGWDMDRAQSVLDALGPRGPAVFAASFLIGAVAAIGKISKTDPTVFAKAQQSMMELLTPYIQAGLIDEADIASPVAYTIDETGTIKVNEGQEYPGARQEEEVPA